MKKRCRKFYWDGGLWSNTPLREVLNALQSGCQADQQPQMALQQGEPADEAYKVYIVDVFLQQGYVPQDNWEVWQRINEITYADKTDYELKACQLEHRIGTFGAADAEICPAKAKAHCREH